MTQQCATSDVGHVKRISRMHKRFILEWIKDVCSINGMERYSKYRNFFDFRTISVASLRTSAMFLMNPSTLGHYKKRRRGGRHSREEKKKRTRRASAISRDSNFAQNGQCAGEDTLALRALDWIPSIRNQVPPLRDPLLGTAPEGITRSRGRMPDHTSGHRGCPKHPRVLHPALTLSPYHPSSLSTSPSRCISSLSLSLSLFLKFYLPVPIFDVMGDRMRHEDRPDTPPDNNGKLAVLTFRKARGKLVALYLVLFSRPVSWFTPRGGLSQVHI